MIGKLTGRIDTVSGNQLILDVNGVGYLVSCSAHSLRLAGEIGDTAALWIETQVREDAINLFGFVESVERDWFRLLTTVQGVGSKSALSILGILSPERLAQAIAAGDKNVLTAADGVGPKLATRIASELKDKVAHMPALRADSSAGPSRLSAVPMPQNSITEDALSALMNLGYRRMEAFAAVSRATSQLGTETTLNDLIRVALSELSRQEGAA